MSNPQQPSQAMDFVIARAATDREFRAALLREPHAAILQTFGVRIPEDFRVRFIEKDPDVDALVVLPPLQAAADGELSEQDLEAVAGGAEGDAGWTEPPPPT